MTYGEINDMLNSFGLPVAYYEFKEDTDREPPFIVFFYAYDDLHADNSNYGHKVQLNIELYTDIKDIDQETELEQRLTELGFSYGKESQFIESERMWQTLYYMEVFING